MRNFILSLSLGVAACSSIVAENYSAHSQLNGWPSTVNLDFGAGYRQDDFKWSIAGLDNFPSVLSELEWKNLQIAQVEGSLSYASCRNYAFRVSGDYGHIYDGKNKDTDYFSNDSDDIFSLSHNKAGKGSVYDVEGGVGYRVISNCARFTATPLVGYSYHGQNLSIYDGKQIFSLAPTDLSNIDGLNTSYHAHWYGPWFGLDFNAQVEKCAYIFGNFEWHIVSYRGRGHWNLRPELGPFYHKAHGFGYSAVLGGNWEIWDNWSIGVVGTYRNMRTRHGTEKFTIKTDEGDLKGKTRFNQAKWQSFSVSGIVAYRF